MDFENTDRPLSLKQAAERLGVSKASITRLVRSGELPTIRVGARRLILPDDLTAFIKRNRDGGRQQ
jgi:excisionase family DNA binding protein